MSKDLVTSKDSAVLVASYNVERARGEFSFINAGFYPLGKADAKESEGGILFIQLLNPSQRRPPVVDSINTTGGTSMSQNVLVVNHTPRLTITVPPPNKDSKTLLPHGFAHQHRGYDGTAFLCPPLDSWIFGPKSRGHKRVGCGRTGIIGGDGSCGQGVQTPGFLG